MYSRETHEHHLSQVFKSTSVVTSYAAAMHPCYDVKKRARHLCGLPLRSHNVDLIMRKPSNKHKMRGILQSSDQSDSNCQGH